MLLKVKLGSLVRYVPKFIPVPLIVDFSCERYFYKELFFLNNEELELDLKPPIKFGSFMRNELAHSWNKFFCFVSSIVQEHLRGVSVSESLVILQQEFQINPAEDLNKLSDKELKHRKAIMDLSFEKNRLDRDHPYFVYDKEVEFSGKRKIF